MKNTDLNKYYNHPKLPKSINQIIKDVIEEDKAYVADELVELSEQILLELASLGISCYLSQSIPYATLLWINYKDNSKIENIGIPFSPYTIKLEIKIDTEIVAEKETTIIERGTVEYLDFTFD